jgi:predicted nucleotidyltransferase
VRTLSRRLTELQAEGLIEKAGLHYRIPGEGFMAALKIAELEEWAGRGVAKPDPEELAKVRYGWLRISLERLTELFLGEFSRELVSMILYGSAVKSSFRLGRSDVDLLHILEEIEAIAEVTDNLARGRPRFRDPYEYPLEQYEAVARETFPKAKKALESCQKLKELFS